MSAKFTVVNSFERKLENLIARRLNAVGKFLSETLFENLSVNYYPEKVSSQRGEYPRMRTQFLRDESLEHAFDRSEMQIEVGPSFEIYYAEALVLMDRKLAPATLEENIDEVVRIFYEG